MVIGATKKDDHQAVLFVLSGWDYLVVSTTIGLPKLYFSPVGATNSFFRCQPRPQPADFLATIVFLAFGAFTSSVILTSLCLGYLLISTGVPANLAVQWEHRIALVSSSVLTALPQKKHSNSTLWTRDFLDIDRVPRLGIPFGITGYLR